MSTLNLELLQWIAAGHAPARWPLLAASVFALWGSWMCAACVGWAVLRRPDARRYIVAAAVAAGVASLVSHFVAAYLNVPRPFVQGLVPAYIAHSASGSMPSAHATVMFLLAFTFLLRGGLRGIGVALFILAAVTGWARVYVGVHFPFDIAGGFLLALVLTGIFVALQRVVPGVAYPSNGQIQ